MSVDEEERRDRTKNHENQVEIKVKVEKRIMLDGAAFRFGKKKDAETNDGGYRPESNRSPNLKGREGNGLLDYWINTAKRH